jgi:hypothetical protein
MTGELAVAELRRALEGGTAPGEDFYMIRVSGADYSLWCNVTPEQLAAMLAALEATL